MLRVPARVEGVAWRTPPIQRLPALEADPNNMTSVQSPLCLAQYKTLGEAVKDQIPPGGIRFGRYTSSKSCVVVPNPVVFPIETVQQVTVLRVNFKFVRVRPQAGEGCPRRPSRSS